MIDQKTTQCEICTSATSAPIEHYPYLAVCSDCDNDLWIQSGSEPLYTEEQPKEKDND